jgi:hypothetical protein
VTCVCLSPERRYRSPHVDLFHGRRCLVIANRLRVAVAELAKTRRSPTANRVVLQKNACVQDARHNRLHLAAHVDVRCRRRALVVTQSFRVSVAELASVTPPPTAHAAGVQKNARVVGTQGHGNHAWRLSGFSPVSPVSSHSSLTAESPLSRPAHASGRARPADARARAATAKSSHTADRSSPSSTSRWNGAALASSIGTSGGCLDVVESDAAPRAARRSCDA